MNAPDLIPSTTVNFEAFGVQVELTVGDPELEASVREILPPGWQGCEAAASAARFGLWKTDEDTYEVTVDGAPGLEHATLAVALTLLDSQIRLLIAANARDRLFVHAGVVARAGRALVIPGESFSGKTTLIGALLDAGATYYSDEYAVLDEAGLVHPYPRALSIRSSEGGTRERRAPERDGSVRDAGARLAVVAVTRYRPLSAGQGLVALMANTVPAQERPEETLRTLRRAMAGATVLESDRGEAGPVASVLLEELAAVTP